MSITGYSAAFTGLLAGIRSAAMDFTALAAECAPTVAPETMAAIVRVESRFQPYAININGGARLERQPASLPEAVATAEWLIAHGYNIDVGLGQVNSTNLPKLGLAVKDAFDPCRNLIAASKILTDNYITAKQRTSDNQAALHAALSAYNTGSFTRGFGNGYVSAVLKGAGVAQGSAGPIKLVAVLPARRSTPAKRRLPLDKMVAATEKAPELVY
jgi:type IV secretion system protein VirB1